MRNTMKALVFSLLISSFYASNSWAIDPSEALENPEHQALYQQITAEVRCLVCQNQTIADSTAPLAADLRREIRRMIEAGENEAQIKEFLVDRYGGFVLYKPQFESWNILLWLAPLVLLIAGLVAVVRFTRKRADLPIDEDAA